MKINLELLVYMDYFKYQNYEALADLYMDDALYSVSGHIVVEGKDSKTDRSSRLSQQKLLNLLKWLRFFFLFDPTVIK